MTIAKVDTERCTACSTCVDVCPMDVLRDLGDGMPAIRYPEDCQCCYMCELSCPADALLVLPERAFVPAWADPAEAWGFAPAARRGQSRS